MAGASEARQPHLASSDVGYHILAAPSYVLAPVRVRLFCVPCSLTPTSARDRPQDLQAMGTFTTDVLQLVRRADAPAQVSIVPQLVACLLH